jgi:cell division protein FtsW (lipid II flippase)
LAAAVAVSLILATFAEAGLMGVHRWVKLGPSRIHASAICLPILIVAMGMLAFSAPKLAGTLASLLGVGVMVLLAWQPDAAQATAFAGGLLVLLLFFRRRLVWTVWAAAAGTAVCAVWAWKRPDPLLAIPHVEGIVGLAADSGALWWLAAVAALAILPLPFLLARSEDGTAPPTSLALGVYVCLTLIAPWFGNFPVPLLGYGVSPMIGYFVALSWLLKRERLAGGFERRV